MNWHELSATSHYQTAIAIEEELKQGHIDEATAGIEEFIDALSRAEKRALRSQLTRLMAHIIKWKIQPRARSRSWARTIVDARIEIEEIQEETPSLNAAVIKQLWDKCFQSARRNAEAEMNQPADVTELAWDEVFDKDYQVN